MEVSVKCEARHICIRLSGELDHHSAKGLLRRLDQEIEKALPTQLTLDLSGVTFMDSSGIALLIPGPAADAGAGRHGRCLRCHSTGPPSAGCGGAPTLSDHTMRGEYI